MVGDTWRISAKRSGRTGWVTIARQRFGAAVAGELSILCNTTPWTGSREIVANDVGRARTRPPVVGSCPAGSRMGTDRSGPMGTEEHHLQRAWRLLLKVGERCARAIGDTERSYNVSDNCAAAPRVAFAWDSTQGDTPTAALLASLYDNADMPAARGAIGGAIRRGSL